MSKLLEVYFHPVSPSTILPESFTLFGAICWGIKVLFGDEEVRDLIERFTENPPFILSSPIFINKGKRLFPKPILEGGWHEARTPEEYSLRKKLKKVSFIDEENFKKILDGDIKTDYELSQNISGSFSENPYERVNTVHAQINRITWTTTEGNLYNETVFYVALPFVVFILFYDEEIIEKVQASLKFVQIGGNRSTGMGVYKVEFREYKGWMEDYIKEGKRFISLSPHFYDTSFDLEESFFNVFPYRGAVDNYYDLITKNIWKKRVLYMDKGSNIKIKAKKKFYGGFKEALRGENISIYQYGYAFPLFVRWEE